MNARMLHGILVFYVIITYFSYPKIHVQNLVCPKCAQNRIFHQKMRAEKASWKSPRSLIFQWQRGWDSNPRWLITTLDFELLHSFVLILVCRGIPRWTPHRLLSPALYRHISSVNGLSKSCQINASQQGIRHAPCGRSFPFAGLSRAPSSLFPAHQASPHLHR